MFPSASDESASEQVRLRAKDLLLLLLLAVAAPLVHGYHLGQEDQFVYLPAIKKHLDSSLYPHDSAIFLMQTRFSLFDEWVAYSVKLTHVPLDHAVILWHLLSLFLILLASLQLSRRCFPRAATQWAAVSTLWAALVMPVAGTKLNLTDIYLHPRDLATAGVLFALVAVLDRRLVALAWDALAAAIHPTMAAFGAFHLAVQAWKVPRKAWATALLLPPLGIFFGRVHNEAWHEVLATRRFLFPLRWHWYEWLGVVVPLAMLVWFARIARRKQAALVDHICWRVVLAGCLGVAASTVISTVPAFERLIPSEPMRTLHFVHLLWVFLGGGLLGECVLRNRRGRWLAWLLGLCAVFFLADRLVYPASPHVEWPGRVARNSWVEGYAWVRSNTPRDALFALDPMYFRKPGVDAHSFRALADRSQLFDWWKDRGVAATWPELSARWLEQMRDLERWEQFGPEDLRRLQQRYGVSWVILDRRNPPRGLIARPTAGPATFAVPCPYTNNAVMVCGIE
jgi:hypothetical protein